MKIPETRVTDTYNKYQPHRAQPTKPSLLCMMEADSQKRIPSQLSCLVATVCFHIIRNLETMHDWDLPTFYIRALRIIWKRTRTWRRGSTIPWSRWPCCPPIIASAVDRKVRGLLDLCLGQSRNRLFDLLCHLPIKSVTTQVTNHSFTAFVLLNLGTYSVKYYSNQGSKRTFTIVQSIPVLWHFLGHTVAIFIL